MHEEDEKRFLVTVIRGLLPSVTEILISFFYFKDKTASHWLRVVA